MRDKPRGLSLLETIFSLFIFSLVLSALSSALSSAGQIQSNRPGMDQASETFHTLSLMAADAAAELQLVTPAINSTSASLVIDRVDPRKPFYDRISPLGDELNPYESQECIRVIYQIENDYLQREIITPGEPSRKERLIGSEEFKATRSARPGTLLTLELTVRGLRVNKKSLVKVCLR